MQKSDWKKCKLGDVCKFQNGKKPSFSERGTFPVYGGNGAYGFSDFSNAKPGNIVIGRVGAYCGSLYYLTMPSWITDNAILATPTTHERFLFYLLLSKNLNRMSQGGAQPLLNQSILNGVDINLPPLEEQKRIAQILGALDDKIELLQKQNKTLEDMAKAIFKSWFVDFDVVHAKANLEKRRRSPTETLGDDTLLTKADIMREYHLTDELYDLFPSDFENSSLGPIPSGWQVKTVQDVAKVVGGGTPSTKEPTFFAQKGTAIPWLTPKDLSGYSHKYISHGQTDITQEGLNKSSAQLMPPNSIVFSSRAPIGYIAISLENITTNQGFKSLVPQKVQYTEFLYQYLCYHKHTIENLGTGSTFKEVSGSVMKNISLCFPNDSILKVYEERNTVVNKKLKNNLKQIQTLTELRDTLLPSLISGKIRV